MNNLRGGWLDLPAGGKLPPAPTYRLRGVEIQAIWMPIARKSDGSVLYFLTRPTALGFGAIRPLFAAWGRFNFAEHWWSVTSRNEKVLRKDYGE